MLKKVLINIAIIFLCILGISAEGRAEEWSENNCIEVVSKYYDLMYDSYLSLQVQDFSDVLDMDVPQNINKIVALNRVVTNWEYQLGVNPELIHPTRKWYLLNLQNYYKEGENLVVNVNVQIELGETYPIFICKGTNVFYLAVENGKLKIVRHEYEGRDLFEGEGNEVQSFNKELFIQELNNITQQKVIEDANEAYLVMPAGTIGFNKQRAYNYATTYASQHNPFFHYYQGANCTNFVSPIVSYGFGDTENALLNTSYRVTSSWQGNGSGGTTNWVSVVDFWNYMCSAKSLGPVVNTRTTPTVGCVMQLYNASAAYWKHSVYIYAYVNGDYKCAQNSADTIRSFNDYAALGFSNRRYFVPMYFYE